MAPDPTVSLDARRMAGRDFGWADGRSIRDRSAGPVQLPGGATVPLLSRRRDPYWDVDGAAARRSRRRQGAVSVIAFATAFAACDRRGDRVGGGHGRGTGGHPDRRRHPASGRPWQRRQHGRDRADSVLLFAMVISAAAIAGRGSVPATPDTGRGMIVTGTLVSAMLLVMLLVSSALTIAISRRPSASPADPAPLRARPPRGTPVRCHALVMRAVQ